MPLLQDYNKLFEHTDNIKKIYVNNTVVWPSTPPPPDPKLEPFYVENISNNVETLRVLKRFNSNPTITIEYSTDKTTWQTFGTTSTTALTMTLQPGGKIYLRCNTNVWNGNRITGISKVGGNIMSLLYGSNFTGQETSFPTNDRNTFNLMFSYDTSILVNAADLILPATILVQSCYFGMFDGCTSLTTAPVLPATTLAQSCYSTMFTGCASLTSAPVLPATVLVQTCYSYMFHSCTSLNTVKCLATNISASNATSNWLYNVSSTGSFTKAAGVTWPSGESGIPSGWTVIEV